MSEGPPNSARLAHLETQVASVAGSLNTFINDSKEHRARIETDQNLIWKALREQGEQLREAVEKLSAKGQISWPMILSTVGLMVTLIGCAAGIGHVIMEYRIRQVEIREESIQEKIGENRQWIRELERERRVFPENR